MTKILKGDTSGTITVAFATGYDYTGATVHIDFLGCHRSFTGVTAGGSVTFSFTADETAVMPLGAFPLRIYLVKSSGDIQTIKNGEVKIGVTDDVSEVYAGATITVNASTGTTTDTSGLATKPSTSALESDSTLDEVITKVNTLLTELKS